MAFKKSFKPRAKRVKRVSKPRTKNLVKLIQKVIHKDVETKIQSVNQALTAYNSGINVGADATKLIPTIVQGTDDGQRVGDTILGQHLNCRGHMILDLPGNNATTNCRIAVRMMVVQPKRYQNDSDCTTYYANWMPYLLQNGANSQAFTGIIQDLYLPINTNAITKYYDKITYLSVPINQVSSAIGIDTADVRRTVKFFNINVPCKKVLKYQDGNNTPINYSPMLIMGYVHLDGSAPDTVSAVVSMAYTTVIKYEDA